MKARREHVIPLPFQAVNMLRTLQGLTGHRQHLFPGRDNPLGPMTSQSLRQLLKSLGWSGIYSPHAARTTGSTRLNEMGYRPDAIEAQLAHADNNNVRRAYNHATYLDERKVMMQEWADKLDRWVRSTEK
jgi:integrase